MRIYIIVCRFRVLLIFFEMTDFIAFKRIFVTKVIRS